jgi:hypothetical protein
MKIIVTLIALLAAPAAYAQLYKCTINGGTVYQQKPCKGEGSEFVLKKDITPEQQQAAKERLEAELAEKAEKQLLQEEQAPAVPMGTQGGSRIILQPEPRPYGRQPLTGR